MTVSFEDSQRHQYLDLPCTENIYDEIPCVLNEPTNLPLPSRYYELRRTENVACDVTPGVQNEPTNLPLSIVEGTNISRWKIAVTITGSLCILLAATVVVVVILSYQVTPCSSNPCLHNGVCSYEKKTSRPTCKCQAGFSGFVCEVTPCSNEPCFNGGSCTLTAYSQHYTCRCPSGFSGNNCQVTPCSGNPCSSNGRCIIDNDSFVCYCQYGYIGSYCEASFHRNISSPNYPNKYTDNLNISWNINVGLGNVASLSFINFTTEAGYDFVRIYDGQSTSSSQIGEFSGVIGLPTVVTSTGQYMHVNFTSDGSQVRKGFYATIYQNQKPV